MPTRHLLVPLTAALLVPACFDIGASNDELRVAMIEVVADGQAQSLEGEVTELTTDFTIGGAVEDIAMKVRDLVQSQIDCSTVLVIGNTVDIDLGGLDDGCVYNGHTFAGKISLVFTYDPTGTKVVVDHTYTGLTNGEITLDGTKKVEWDAEARHVLHDLTWTRDGRSVHATGDRTLLPLDPAHGFASGVEVDGERAWETDKGTYDLAIDHVEARWIDPVPQAGSYMLTTPTGKILTMRFARVDADTIAVTVSGGRRDRVYHISSTGTFEDQRDV